MPSFEELVSLADEAVFIFTAGIVRANATTVATLPAKNTTVVVSVDDVLKAPVGLRGFSGQEVTVHLREPLREGKYVFFADPLAVGNGIAVRERAHIGADERGRAAEALERGYVMLIERHAQAAFLVALGTVGQVRPLLPPAERRARVPWSTAPFEIERVLKGRKNTRRMTLVGPVPASKRLPRAPALREGLHGILFLQRPPEDAVELIRDEERQALAFIAEPADIQPPERLETIARILGGAARIGGSHAEDRQHDSE